MPVSDDMIALPRDQARELAGVTERQIDYWDHVGLLSPSVVRRLGPRSTVRLYSFTDVLELLIVAQLVVKHPLQRVRRVVERLRDRGYERPLSQVEFGVDKSDEIVFRHRDGTWEGSRLPDQLVAREVLDLEMLRAQIRTAVESPRDPESVGRIEKRRGVLGSKPVFAGTRVPVEAVTAYLERDLPTERILEAFPNLTPEDVEAARDAAGVA